MTVKTLYRFGTTVSPNKPETEEYTTLLRVSADDGYVLQLADGTLTNVIDCETTEGITEVVDTVGRQMEMMGYNDRMNNAEEALSSMKSANEERLDEIEAAMMELAAQQADTQAAQQEAEVALMELAAISAQ